jgi:polar amino acid transport system substrate-binding protein
MDCNNTKVVGRSARTWVWLASVLAVVFGSFAHSIQAAEPAKQVLPVGLSEFPPFEYKNASGKVVGADTEIVEAVLRRAGYVPDFKVQPWARVQQSALRGEFAMVFSMTKSKEREALYWFSEPINAVKDVFFKDKKTPLLWKTYDDLKTMRVGGSAGYGYDAGFKQASIEKRFAAYLEVFDAEPESSGLRLLSSGAIDAFVCEVSVCQYLIKINAPKFDHLNFSPQPIGLVRPYYAAFPKSWPNSENLQREFNAGLAKLIQEGEWRKILVKYRMEPKLP